MDNTNTIIQYMNEDGANLKQLKQYVIFSDNVLGCSRVFLHPSDLV